MEMKRSVVGWKVPEGTETVSFARSSFNACPRSVRTALQSRFGTFPGAEITFLGHDPTSPASGPLARVGPPFERSSATSLRLLLVPPRLAVAKKKRTHVHKHCPRSILDPSTNSRGLITHPPTWKARFPCRSHTGPSFLYFRLGSSSSICRCPPEAKVTQSRRSGVIFGRSSWI